MNNKLTALALSLLLLPSLLLTAHAAETEIIALKAGSPWCVVGTEAVLLDSANPDVVPVVDAGRTLVPIRRVMENFGGQLTWVANDKPTTCTLDGNRVEITLGASTALVNDISVPLDVPAKLVGGRTFVPLRFVTENLGLQVGYDNATGVVVISRTAYDAVALAALPQVKTLSAKVSSAPAAPTSSGGGDPLSLRSGSFKVSSGTVSANIITVDMSNPRVSVKVSMVDGALNHTRNFKDILAGSAAVAAVNGNFFKSYEDIQDPIGHVMSSGSFLYGNSGLSSLGFTADNQMRWGRPPVFIRIKPADGSTEWSAYSVNTQEQTYDGSVLYTPARGTDVTALVNGAAMTVQAGQVAGYRTVSAGELVSIPQNGFLFLMGEGFTATHYYRVPTVGQQVSLEPYLRTSDPEGFLLDGVTDMVTGAPRLVRGGSIETFLDPGFTEARFTSAVTPRTAVGTTKDGKLLLVNSPSAGLQALRELMLQLGCVEAVNLDGGASTGMYFKGDFIAMPGRALTTTLQIFVDG